MSNAVANPYLRTKIMTASSEELRLMLYEGAIKFTHQGIAAIEASEFENSYNSLMRAQKIVLELSTSLNFDIAPFVLAPSLFISAISDLSSIRQRLPGQDEQAGPFAVLLKRQKEFVINFWNPELVYHGQTRPRSPMDRHKNVLYIN